MRYLVMALFGPKWTCTICGSQQSGAYCTTCGWWAR